MSTVSNSDAQKKINRTLLFFGAAAVVGWLIWRSGKKSKSGGGKHSSGGGSSGNGQVIELMSPAEIASYSGVLLFYMNGCGPCNAVKPAFEEAASMAAGVAQFAQVERAVSQSLLDKYNVSGFPTIVKMTSGSVRDVFNGPRSAQSIARFASGS